MKKQIMIFLITPLILSTLIGCNKKTELTGACLEAYEVSLKVNEKLGMTNKEEFAQKQKDKLLDKDEGYCKSYARAQKVALDAINK